eukprot:Anaeramoba_flamelloidesa346494_8.p2 GENE.a346494_8~~a346494_8.p2  ORF type:complete len:120 (-),score=13.46 a346494_8:51-410(-)
MSIFSKTCCHSCGIPARIVIIKILIKTRPFFCVLKNVEETMLKGMRTLPQMMIKKKQHPKAVVCEKGQPKAIPCDQKERAIQQIEAKTIAIMDKPIHFRFETHHIHHANDLRLLVGDDH